jgi:hypothetical protein
MNCKICFENYDNINHKPMILFPCAHSFCSTCVVQLETCSSCQQNIVDRKPNHDLLENLDQVIYVSQVLKQSVINDLKEVENLNTEMNSLNNQVLNEVQTKIDTATKIVIDQTEEYKKKLLNEIDLIKNKSFPKSDTQEIGLQLKDIHLLDLSKMKSYKAEIDMEILRLESKMNQIKQISIEQIDQEIANILSNPLNLITNSKNEKFPIQVFIISSKLILKLLTKF